MLKIYIKNPESLIGKTFFPIFLGFFLVFFTSILEHKFRHPNDLNTTNKVCGVILKYYFDDTMIRGLSTWRLAIRLNDSYRKKTFRVGEAYLQNKIKETSMKTGEEICIYFTKRYVPFSDPFITQIALSEKNIFTKKEIIVVYMNGISRLEKYTLIFLTAIVILFIIKIEKE